MHQSISMIVMGVLLAALSNYSQVNAIDLPENLPFVMERPIEPSFLDQTFDIRDYGARHGDQAKNTKAVAEAIAACHKQGKYVGICGQGPSDHPDLAKWLLEQNITSVSLNPDTVIDTWLFMAGQKSD